MSATVARLEKLLSEKYRQLEQIAVQDSERAKQHVQRQEQVLGEWQDSLKQKGALPLAQSNQTHSQNINGKPLNFKFS